MCPLLFNLCWSSQSVSTLSLVCVCVFTEVCVYDTGWEWRQWNIFTVILQCFWTTWWNIWSVSGWVYPVIQTDNLTQFLLWITFTQTFSLLARSTLLLHVVFFIIILTNGTCTVGFILLSTACTVEIKQSGHKSTQIREMFCTFSSFYQRDASVASRNK